LNSLSLDLSVKRKFSYQFILMTCLNYSTCHFKLSQLYQKLPDFFFILPVHDILNIILKIHVSVASISSTITTTVDAGSNKAGCTLSPAESN